MQFQVIRVNGTIETHHCDSREVLHAVKRLIGAQRLDTVRLRDRQHVMLVNDDGYDVEMVDHGERRDPHSGRDVHLWQHKPVTAKLPVNNLATALYHKVSPNRAHQIVGDVAIVNDRDVA